MHQQILLGYGAAAAPPSVTFDTSALSNRTFITSAALGTLYKGISTSAGLAVANDDPIQRIDSSAGPATIRTFADNTSPDTRFLKIDTWGAGLHSIRRISGYAYYMPLYTRPTGTNNPSTTNAISTLWGENAKTLIFAGIIHDIGADTVSPWTNAAIISNEGGYCGLHGYKSGSNAVLQWYFYGRGDLTVEATVALGTPFAVACRHVSTSSGTIGISLNNGPWTTKTGVGSTASMTGRGELFKGKTSLDVSLAALVTCNENNTDENIATVCTNAGALMGITI